MVAQGIAKIGLGGPAGEEGFFEQACLHRTGQIHHSHHQGSDKSKSLCQEAPLDLRPDRKKEIGSDNGLLMCDVLFSFSSPYSCRIFLEHFFVGGVV